MLNEERIILMTKLASYEAGEGRKNAMIGNYFRSDYIGWQVLKSIISATIAFVVVFAMYIFYDFEIFMIDIYKMDLMEFGRKILSIYAGVVGGYAAVSYIVYSFRYARARQGMRLYFTNLKKLYHMYGHSKP